MAGSPTDFNECVSKGELTTFMTEQRNLMTELTRNVNNLVTRIEQLEQRPATAELCDNPDTPCYTMFCQPILSGALPAVTNLLQEFIDDGMKSRTTPILEGEDDEDIAKMESGRLQFKKGRMMRTSPRWTHRRYGLSQVAIRPQLSCHVTLGFSRHVVTVLVITLSYDIKMGRSWMRWKGDDDAVVLDLVPAPEGPWIILCDHVKVLRHLFGPTWPCIVSGLKPKLWAPNP
jgi:hypothetical protein